MSSQGQSFPERVMSLLDAPEFVDCICWNTDGTAFRIFPETFVEKALKNHMQGCKFSSFQRRLVRWGFQRVILKEEFPLDAFVYRHDLFQRGARHLLSQVTSRSMRKTFSTSSLPSTSSTNHVLPEDATHVPPSASCPVLATYPHSFVGDATRDNKSASTKSTAALPQIHAFKISSNNGRGNWMAPAGAPLSFNHMRPTLMSSASLSVRSQECWGNHVQYGGLDVPGLSRPLMGSLLGTLGLQRNPAPAPDNPHLDRTTNAYLLRLLMAKSHQP